MNLYQQQITKVDNTQYARKKWRVEKTEFELRL